MDRSELTLTAPSLNMINGEKLIISVKGLNQW